MNQENKVTEIICWPERIEFGGVPWIRSERTLEQGAVEYCACAPNETKLRIYRYPRKCEQWLWKASFGIKTNINLVHGYEVGVIVASMEEAMISAVNAFNDWLDDMQRILRIQRPGDRYALGWEDGQAALAAKVMGVLS